jgi:hypothetical protein
MAASVEALGVKGTGPRPAGRRWAGRLGVRGMRGVGPVRGAFLPRPERHRVRLHLERRNHMWAYDFVEDRPGDGREFRVNRPGFAGGWFA